MADTHMASFRARTLSGVAWSSGQQIGDQAMQVVISVVLARLLLPADFGLVGMVVVFTGFASLFVDFGLGAAVIQRRHVRAEHLDTVFWTNTGAGLALTTLFAALAPLIASFYGEPRLLPITALLSLNFVLGALAAVHRALLSKELDFRRIALIGWGSRAVVGLAGIGAALAGWGVWSIVFYMVASSLYTTIALWVACPWRPRWCFSVAALRELFGFSSHYFGFQSVNYWARNADNLLVGKFLGTAALGIYAQAYTLMLFPLRQVSSVISRVLFPAFATIQDDPVRIGRVYLKMCQTVALVTAPLMAGLAVVTEPFVYAVFGPNWAPMIPLLRVLAIVGFVQSVGALVGNLYLSRGRSDLMFRVGGAVAAVGLVAIVLGLRWGIMGVATAYSAASLLTFIPQQFLALRLVGLSIVDLLRALAGVAAAALLMGVLTWFLAHVLPSHWSAPAQLSVLVPTGALIYVAIIHGARVGAYRDLLAIIVGRLESHRRAAARKVEPAESL